MDCDSSIFSDPERISVHDLLERVGREKFALRNNGADDDEAMFRDWFDIATIHEEWDKSLRAVCACGEIVARDSLSGLPAGPSLDEERWARCLVSLDDADKFWRRLGYNYDLFRKPKSATTAFAEQPLPPEDQAECEATRGEAELDAWKRIELRAKDAANVLCGLSPLNPGADYPKETMPSGGTWGSHSNLLRLVFDGVERSAPGSRTLSHWIQVAKDNNLGYHPCIDMWLDAKWIPEQAVATFPAGAQPEANRAAPTEVAKCGGGKPADDEAGQPGTDACGNATEALGGHAATWIVEARRLALAYIERHKAQSLFPSQADVCAYLEGELRNAKIYGSHDRPLAEGYIKRNAIQGEWWKKNKP